MNLDANNEPLHHFGVVRQDRLCQHPSLITVSLLYISRSFMWAFLYITSAVCESLKVTSVHYNALTLLLPYERIKRTLCRKGFDAALIPKDPLLNAQRSILQKFHVPKKFLPDGEFCDSKPHDPKKKHFCTQKHLPKVPPNVLDLSWCSQAL